jgi:hypothetical protein
MIDPKLAPIRCDLLLISANRRHACTTSTGNGSVNYCNVCLDVLVHSVRERVRDVCYRERRNQMTKAKQQ